MAPVIKSCESKAEVICPICKKPKNTQGLSNHIKACERDTEACKQEKLYQDELKQRTSELSTSSYL